MDSQLQAGLPECNDDNRTYIGLFVFTSYIADKKSYLSFTEKTIIPGRAEKGRTTSAFPLAARQTNNRYYDKYILLYDL